MTTQRKPTAREAWEAIDDAAFMAEVERVVGMSDDEVRAELVSDGFDPAKLGMDAGPSDEKGKGAEPAKPAAPARVIRMPLRARITKWPAAAAAAALIAGLATVTMTPVMVGHAPRPADRGALLRKEAQEACAKAEWRVCKEKLDTADDVDPSGANDASIKQLREKAERGLSGR